jgi:hypothetical protein
MRDSEFLDVLNRFKINLAATPRALTNEDIREHLLLALPSDVTWQNAKTWCLRDKRSLEECVILLQEHETALPQSAAFAQERKDEPRGRRGNRGRARSGKNRGRTGRFDRSSSRHSSSSRVNKSYKSEDKFSVIA